jgi:hypothetical protein
MRGRRAILRAALALAVIGAAAAQEDYFAFMPEGGRTLLLGRLAGAEGAALADVAQRAADRADWADWARAQAPDLTEAEAATFAGYAARNFPLPETALARLAEQGAAALPPDGKDLAVAQCQTCHSFFTGYLMQDRDETSWKGTFKAPFHAEIPMSEAERDTFARYSARNMPMAFEDVPPELRY